MGAKMLFMFSVFGIVIQVPLFIFVKVLTYSYLPDYGKFIDVFPFILLLGFLRASNQILRSIYTSLRKEIFYIKRTIFLLVLILLVGSLLHYRSSLISFEYLVVILPLPELVFFLLLILPKLFKSKYFQLVICLTFFSVIVFILCHLLEGEFVSSYGILGLLSLFNAGLSLLLINKFKGELKEIIT